MGNLYSADQKSDFGKLFSKPSSLYGDTPFWSWNCKLDKDQLMRQIGVFEKMGMGGFHMHPRTGLATPYLSGEFLDLVKSCVTEAKKRGMKAHLYDEDRWPSGFAGGLVTKDEKYRARHLRISRTELPEATENCRRDLLKKLALTFDKDCRLVSARVLSGAARLKKGEEIRYVYRQIDCNNEWYNFQAYVDTLNPEAIRRFIEVTHERYFKKVGGEFGKTIPSIFTDEPQFCEKHIPRFAADSGDVVLPYTDRLPEEFAKRCGADFWTALPEVIYERADGAYSVLRYRFHDLVAEMFAAAFADIVGAWCCEHGIDLTGHMMEEPTLESQTHALGEAMRSYRSFGMPGIDMLCDKREYSTAKQAQSASRQFGRGGVLSELDGVTDWDFDFAGHKSHGDWQAALGVTVRVPHLSWVSMEGEAKHDYPASISYQSPWHHKYRLVADHFSRVNVAMTRGKAVSRIGVIHPVESFWLIYGPQDQTSRVRTKAEAEFKELIDSLIFGLMDFDFIAESLLPLQGGKAKGGKLQVGEMAYDVIVVPPTITLRGTTLTVLEKFRKAGGRIIFAGDVATLCDAEKSDRPAKLAANCEKIAFSRNALLDALEPVRFLSVRSRESGYESDKMIYQLRENGKRLWLFIVNAAVRHTPAFRARIELHGEYKVTLLDTATGERAATGASYENGRTFIDYDFYPAGHLLLELEAGRCSDAPAIVQPHVEDWWIERNTVAEFGGLFEVELSEPNVLMLDQAEYRVAGDKTFAPKEELMRVGRKFMERFTGGKSGGHCAQPWSWPQPPVKFGRVELKFSFECEVAVKNVLFALEKSETTDIWLDGKRLSVKPSGYWTDESIKALRLPALAKGRHEILLSFDFFENSSCQWCYLLGDFGVRVQGRDAVVTAPVRQLAWGDICAQGLPFYGGNITYRCEAVLPRKQHLSVRLPSFCENRFGGRVPFADGSMQGFAAFSGVMVGVRVDGGEEHDLAFAPFEADLGELSKGRHVFEFTLYGHRGNCFGGVHLMGNIDWAGANNWYTEGDFFSYEYRLQQLGIFCSPKLIKH